MARDVNRWFGIGNLGRDPEVRYTQSGTAVATTAMACSERRKRGQEWEDHTEWINLVFWGKAAENIGQFAKKGTRMWVEGRLQTRSWEQDGQKRYATEVVAFGWGVEARGKDAIERAPHLAPEPGGGAEYDAGGRGQTDDVPFRCLPAHMWRW